MIELKRSEVCFNEVAHTYTLKGRELQGITGMLKRQLFPDKYAWVGQEVLDRAADYGTGVHEAIEVADVFGGKADGIVKAYRELIASAGLERLENEYLVSDGERYASSIDIVFKDGSIADIKTTSSLDKEWLSWQLSVYAYLMEKQNPGLKVPKLYAIWLPREQYGQPKLMPVARKSREEVEALLKADAEGRQYDPEVGEPVVSEELVRELVEINELKRELEEREKWAREALRGAIVARGLNGVKTETFTASYTPAGTTKRFDAKRFKAENGELYQSYMVPAESAERLTIKFANI